MFDADHPWPPAWGLTQHSDIAPKIDQCCRNLPCAQQGDGTINRIAFGNSTKIKARAGLECNGAVVSVERPCESADALSRLVD